MKKVAVLVVLLLAFTMASAHAAIFSLTDYGQMQALNSVAGGTAYVVEYNAAMQAAFNNWKSSGTGVINPFLTIQKQDVEQGWSTDGATIYDQKRSGGGYTRAITGADLVYSPFAGIIIQGGYNLSGLNNYLSFSVDINEPKETPLIKLVDFEIWVLPSTAGKELASTTAITGFSGAVKAFDLYNGSTGDQAMFDYSLWKGSGQELDFALFIPDFNRNDSDIIYVWAKFGDANGNDLSGATSDGFEEWILIGNPRQVPEPTGLILLGLGLMGLAGVRRFRK